jgi:hypothetical protein
MKRPTEYGILLLAAVMAICGVACSSGSSGGTMGGSGDGPDAVMLMDGPDTTLRGNAGGGTLGRDVCPADEMLVGLSGEVGSGGWIVKLQAVCGVPEIEGIGGGEYVVTFTTGSTLAMRGALSGTSFSRTCPADRVLVGFSGRSGLLIDQLTLQCAQIVYREDGSNAWSQEVRDPVDLSSVGGNGGTAFDQTNCPTGQIARGATIRYGDSIDAFGMICATPEAVDI